MTLHIVWGRHEVLPQTVNVTVLRPRGEEQRVSGVLYRASACCRASQWPESTRAIALLPSLCSSLPSYNIKTVPLCACILGNLPPTMESALASAWEEYGAMERKSKGEEDRGRWKTGRQAEQKRRVTERVTVFVVHRRAGQNEVAEQRVKEGKEARQMRRGWGSQTCASCELSFSGLVEICVTPKLKKVGRIVRSTHDGSGRWTSHHSPSLSAVQSLWRCHRNRRWPCLTQL